MGNPFLKSELSVHIKVIVITFFSTLFKALSCSCNRVHLKILIAEFMWGLTLRLVKLQNISLRKLKTVFMDILTEKYLQRLAADLLLCTKSHWICLYFSYVLSLQKWNAYFQIFNDALPLSWEITQHWRLCNKVVVRNFLVSNEKMVIYSDLLFHLEDNNLKIISACPTFSFYIL